MSFSFTPVVPDLPTLAKTIGGKLEVVQKGKRGRPKLIDDKVWWIARIVGPAGCRVGFQPSNTSMESVYSPSYLGETPESARRGLARTLSRNTFVVRDPQSQTEHRLPLGFVRP